MVVDYGPTTMSGETHVMTKISPPVYLGIYLVF